MAKIRVVLDTNVYVSGLLWTGLPHDLLSAAETGQLVLVTTAAILEEVREVLARPKFAARMSTLSTSVVLRDPDDDKFVACALATRVRWIISGDEHLLRVGRYKNIRMVTPQQFW